MSAPGLQSEYMSARLIRSLSPDADVAEELVRYNETAFRRLVRYPAFPLEDEPFVAAWDRYAEKTSAARSILAVSDELLQLGFGIYSGISQDPTYLRATQFGEIDTDHSPLQLRSPEECTVVVHNTPAGRLPVITAHDRDDFETLVRAFTKRNEPVPIPSSMGATIVSGYNNWGRINRLRREFENSNADNNWRDEFRRIRDHKSLYQDTFVILSSGPYSGVPGREFGLTEDDWMRLSVSIRREHEFTHYFTRRILGSARNNLLDELIADYSAVTAVTGSLPTGWLNRFLGVDRNGEIHEGRIANYKGKPPLSDAAFVVLARMVALAVINIELIDAGLAGNDRTAEMRARVLLSMSTFTLEDLASANAVERFHSEYEHFRESVVPNLNQGHSYKDTF